MSFCSNLFPYYINNCEIISHTHHKDLGITMSYDLSWSKHTAQISSKAYRILGLLRRTFSATNSTTTRKIEFMYFLGPLTTALQFSDLETCLDYKDVKSLEQMQRRATKFILNRSLHRLQKSAFKITLAPSHDDFGTPRYIVLCKKLKNIGSELQFI